MSPWRRLLGALILGAGLWALVAAAATAGQGPLLLIGAVACLIGAAWLVYVAAVLR